MSDALLINGFVGLKCDAPECSWADMTITREEYPSYRNAPCPNCGANLLTDADWAIVLSMEAAAAWVESNAERLGIDRSSPGEPVSIDYDDLKQAISEIQSQDSTQ